MDKSPLLSLPANVLANVYTFAHGSGRVDVEIDKSNNILTSDCKLLRICRTLRRGIFEVCQRQELRLVYAVRSPIALRHLFSGSDLAFPFSEVRVVLLAEIEGIKLDEEEEVSSSGSHLEPLFKAWRETFRSTPESVRSVYFDLARTFRLGPTGVGKLINLLSAILQRRTKGLAKCRIMGCMTVHGQKYLENSTVNVVPADVHLPGEKVDSSKEYDAGPPPLIKRPRRRENDGSRVAMPLVPPQDPRASVPWGPPPPMPWEMEARLASIPPAAGA